MTNEKNTQVATVQKNIVDSVLVKVNAFTASGELKLPKDYSVENAMKSAFLILSDMKTKEGKPVLEACKRESIANALLKMAVLGLSPLKKQGDFIAYGDELKFQEEYAGNIALAKRFGGLKSIKANAVFKGDDFVFRVNENGRKRVIKHEQQLESIGGEVVGAYAVVELEDGTIDTEIMSIEQIKNSWNQGYAKGNSVAHKNFTDQMAIKTVVNRACKLLIRSSSDVVLYSGEEQTPQDTRDTAIASRANAQAFPVQDIPFEEVDQKPEETKGEAKDTAPEPLKEAVKQPKAAKATKTEVPF